MFKNYYNLSIVDGCQLTLAQHEELRLIETNYFEPSLIAPSEISHQWVQYNPDTIISVKDNDNDKIVAHLTILPITDETYNKFLTGNYKDANMPISDMRKYNEIGEYIIYIAAIAIHPSYTNSLALKMMINAYGEKIIRLASEGIFISQVIAEACTASGENFCKLLGMNKILSTKHDTKIYVSSSLRQLFRVISPPIRNDLIKLYLKKSKNDNG